MQEKVQLLSLLGSFWSELFDDRQLAADIVAARCRLHEQTESDFQFLQDACSIDTIRPLRPVNWYRLRLLESQKNRTTLTQAKYGEDFTYSGNNGLEYGQFGVRRTPAWIVPAELTFARVVQNRINAASVLWTVHQGFSIAENSIQFDEDPFLHDGFVPQEIVVNDKVTDRYIDLWLGGCLFDEKTLQRQFGYVIGGSWASTENSRRLISAIYKSLNHGTSQESTQEIVGAYLDVPFSRQKETVEDVFTAQGQQWVVTDKESYACSPDAVVIVSAGQQLYPGDQLTSGVTWTEKTLPADLPVLVAPGRMTGLTGSLAFINRELPTTCVFGPDGRAEFRFDVRGFPEDVSRFWAETQARGLAAGKTLANLMDLRPVPSGEPMVGSLPQTINPAKFLWDEVYRNNTTLLRVKPRQFGPAALSTLTLDWILRKTTPPNKMVFVVLELQADTEDAALSAIDTVIPVNLGVKQETGTSAAIAATIYSDTAGCST